LVLAEVQNQVTPRIDLNAIRPVEMHAITDGSAPGATTKSYSNCWSLP